MPPREFVMGKLGVDLPPLPPGTAPLFLANEVFNRNLAINLREGMSESADFLDKNDPVAAYGRLQELTAKVNKMNLGDSKITNMFSHGEDIIAYYERMKSGVRGILTPWNQVNEATLGFWPEELILCVARSGVGKCIERSSICVDPDTGVEHTIEQFYNNPAITKVHSWDKKSGIHTREITKKVDTGYKQCFKITFSSGRSITVTPEHPLLTAEGWKRADEFKVGHTAALPARIPFPLKPVRMPMHHVDTLAIMLADGSCTNSDISFTKKDNSIVEIARDAANEFGIQLNPAKTEPNKWGFSQGRGARTPNPVQELLIAHGLYGSLSKNKKIPDSIYRLPEDQLSRFLSVFWMCDGYVDDTGPCVTLASEKMTRQIQSLLLRFGIQSSVGYKKARCQTGDFDSWRLRVYAFSWESFGKSIKLWGHRLAAFNDLLSRSRNTNVGNPVVSDELKNKINEKAKPDGWRDGRLLEVAKRMGRSPSHEKGHGSYWSTRELFGPNNLLRLRQFKIFCDVYGLTDEYEWLWSHDIFWDSIKSIEDVGVQKIYDLTVEPTSCFVANDIILHNTWISLMIAECAWLQKKKVLYVTTEMSKEKIYLRFLAYHLKLPYGKLRNGKLHEYAYGNYEAKLMEGLNHLSNQDNFYIVGGNFDFRVESLASAIDEVKPDLVVIDGIYLIKVPGKDRFERAANTFDETKRLCTHKKIPIVVTSQFNREVKSNQSNTAKAESIALSDAAVWHSSYILGMVQTDENRIEKRMQMKQLKVRDGSGEDFELNWDFETMTFTPIDGGSYTPSTQAQDASDIGTVMASSAETQSDMPF